MADKTWRFSDLQARMGAFRVAVIDRAETLRIQDPALSAAQARSMAREQVLAEGQRFLSTLVPCS